MMTTMPPPSVSAARTLDDLVRHDTAKARILARLRRGPATNVELNAVCFRYGARIHELRRELRRTGLDIVRTARIGGVFTYALLATARVAA